MSFEFADRIGLSFIKFLPRSELEALLFGSKGDHEALEQSQSS